MPAQAHATNNSAKLSVSRGTKYSISKDLESIESTFHVFRTCGSPLLNKQHALLPDSVHYTPVSFHRTVSLARKDLDAVFCLFPTTESQTVYYSVSLSFSW